jgi:hypothetical protein
MVWNVGLVMTDGSCDSQNALGCGFQITTWKHGKRAVRLNGLERGSGHDRWKLRFTERTRMRFFNHNLEARGAGATSGKPGTRGEPSGGKLRFTERTRMRFSNHNLDAGGAGATSGKPGTRGEPSGGKLRFTERTRMRFFNHNLEAGGAGATSGKPGTRGEPSGGKLRFTERTRMRFLNRKLKVGDDGAMSRKPGTGFGQCRRQVAIHRTHQNAVSKSQIESGR